MRIGFISSLSCAPWGGSELLWSKTAHRLLQSGVQVSASVKKWPKRASFIEGLISEGVNIYERDPYTLPSLERRVVMRLRGERITCAATDNHRRWLRKTRPNLVCVSCSMMLDGLAAAEAAQMEGLPYVVICQANSENWWPSDPVAARARQVYGGARRWFFVSEANRRLAEAQLGTNLCQAEVVRNPFEVSYDAAINMVFPDASNGLRLACVGRLDPTAKGQDLVIEAMADPLCRDRKMTVDFFGSGEMEEGLRRNVARFGLQDSIRFLGHVADVGEIWRTHHSLILASRHEGLPIALVEAMLCGRPAVVTATAGNPEVVEDGINGFIAQAPTAQGVGLALEKLWVQRDRLPQMGAAAAKGIRKKVPRDPAAVFANIILDLVREDGKADRPKRSHQNESSHYNLR